MSRSNAQRERATRLLAHGVSQRACDHVVRILLPGFDPEDVLGPEGARGAMRERIRSLRELPLPLTRGGSFRWPVMRPQEFVQALAEEDNPFRRSLADALVASPPSPAAPWHLILYLDELTPGNLLSPQKSRKLTAFYVSFLELRSHLRWEHAWLPCGVLRWCISRQVVGGMSAIVRILLSDFFEGDFGMGTVGFAVGGRLLFAKLFRVVGDSPALQAV